MSSEHHLQAVLFDMDGTLVDTEGLWWEAARSVAAGLGYELGEADLADVLGRPAAHTAAHLHRVTGAAHPADGLAAGLDREFAELVGQGVTLLPGALELLGELRDGGVTLALVSASPRAVVDAVLRSLGAGHFAVTVSADDTPRSKPAPDPYLAAVRALGVRAEACVAVEDSPTGVASAEAAGCRVLVVPSRLPIPPGRDRRVLAGLDEAGLPLLRALVSAPAES